MGQTKPNKMQDGVQFNTMPCIYWDLVTKISYLQRRIIVYSIMYYEMDESCVSDAVYEGISKQLLSLMASASKKEMERTRYYYAMSDYDGSTGFYLPGRLTKEDLAYCREIASIVLSRWRKVGKPI